MPLICFTPVLFLKSFQFTRFLNPSHQMAKPVSALLLFQPWPWHSYFLVIFYWQLCSTWKISWSLQHPALTSPDPCYVPGRINIHNVLSWNALTFYLSLISAWGSILVGSSRKKDDERSHAAIWFAPSVQSLHSFVDAPPPLTTTLYTIELYIGQNLKLSNSKQRGQRHISLLV